jgi:hypothetical protein
MSRFTENWPILGLVLAVFFVGLSYFAAFVIMVVAVFISLFQHAYFKIRTLLRI